jgi:hypothetical protein
MAYVEADCGKIKHYMDWVHGKHMEAMTLDQFALWWRGLSDQERQVEWDKCTLHADFD